MSSNYDKDVGEKSSQTALEPPADIAVPNTPDQIHSPAAVSSPNASLDHTAIAINASDKESLVSPPPPTSSTEMTPPPSAQNMANVSTPTRRSRSESNQFLASPPATVDQTLCVAYGASEHLPTVSDINSADEGTVRKMANELLVVAQEFRMSAAHFKLQHSLLSLTSGEAVKRAEVEQQLARREVEILQSEEYRNRRGLARPGSPQPNQVQQTGAEKRIKELEQINATTDRRLRRAKEIIEEKADKHELLLEENNRLKKRIRDNREHFTLMMDHGSLSSSPRTEFLTPQRKHVNQHPESARSHVSRVGNQDPFAALLAADQVLSRGSTSIQSSPSKHRNHKNYFGHTRATHSLSSLPATPPRPRIIETAHPQYFTPINKQSAERGMNPLASIPQDAETRDDPGRYDRDSTLSASDLEAVTDDDMPASQASSLATSMLRRYPGASQEEPSIPANIGKSSVLLQSKLFGQVKKAGSERHNDKLKRKLNTGDKSRKKARGGDSLALDAGA